MKYRMALVAQQGSVAHADQFCKMEANTYGIRELDSFGEPADGQFPSNAGVVINLLCPRPEPYASAFNQFPTGGTSAGAVLPAPLPPALAPSPARLPATIPVVPVKVPR